MTESTVKILTGNHAASNAVKLCKPDVIAAYPITPQTSLVEEPHRHMVSIICMTSSPGLRGTDCPW